MEAQVEETNRQNEHLMHKLQLVEQERETNAVRQDAPAVEFVLTPTAPQQDLEVHWYHQQEQSPGIAITLARYHTRIHTHMIHH